jgi:hypothetical protein
MRDRGFRPVDIVLACLCFALATAEAAPKFLEPQPTVFPPIPEQFPYAYDVALDGNRLAVATFPNFGDRNVYVYERSSEGTWGTPTLAMTVIAPSHSIPIHIALQGSVLAMTLRNQLHIAERVGSGWMTTATFGTPSGISEMGADVDIDGGTIVVGGESSRAQALIFRKNASGNWQYNGSVNGESFVPGAYEDFYGGDVDISGNTIVVGSTGFTAPGTEPRARAFVFTNTNGAWVQSAVFGYPLQQPEPYGFASTVVVDGDTLILGEGPTLHLYRRSAGTWSYASSARPPEVAIGAQRPSPIISGNLIVQNIAGGNPEGMYLYQRDGAQLRLAAKLVGSFWHIDMSGRNVIGVADGTYLRSIQVPLDLTVPPLRQDNFQDGNATGWTPFPATSWSVVTSGSTRVYRQSNLASESRSVLTGTDWTQQAVQADIKPTAFDGADRWFGLATRYIDSANYYYATLRSSGTVLLRKMVNGNFQTIGSRTLSIVPNQTYRVRLEAVGSQIRLYVNDMPGLAVVDTSLTHGQAALLTYRTRADFDNVVVSPSPLQMLFGDDFFVAPPPDAPPSPSNWIETGTGVWGYPPEEPSDPDFPDEYAHLRNYRQTSISGGARSHVGVSTTDQNVQTRVMPTAMTATGWFGVMARYVDDGNYYYLKVGNGEASIRKLVDGAIVELARAPFTPSVNTWHALRLEVIGTSLRAYINERFLLEASDTSHAAGKYGIVTYRASATFDDFYVIQP